MFDLAGTSIFSAVKSVAKAVVSAPKAAAKATVAAVKSNAGKIVIAAVVVGGVVCLSTVACGVAVGGALGPEFLLAAAGMGSAGVAGQMTGYTRHGLNQVISRDDGAGVSPAAILNALRSTNVSTQDGGRLRFVGDNAVVVLNAAGRLITAYSTGGGRRG